MFYADIYRPVKEEQLIGESQKRIWQSLKKDFENGKIHNKLMFLGDFGLGKTTLAEMYIRMVLELGEIESLDNKIIRINCADSTGVDFHRGIVSQLDRRPLDKKYNIFFLDEIHKLNKDSTQNVWLTPLESLPDFVIIIAATTNPNKLDGGLKSRFEKLHLKKPSNSELKRKARMIIGHRKKIGESITITDKDIDEIIQLAQGNIRDFDGYLQSKIENRFNELDEVKQNKLIFDLIYKPKNDLQSNTKFVFGEIKELEIDYVSFTNMACRSVIGMLRNGSVKGKSLSRAYVFLECFGDGLSPYIDSYVSFHTAMKRYLESI